MWQLVGAFKIPTPPPPHLPSYNISTKRKWGGISFAGEQETILNAISLDIWTAAGLIKGFQQLPGFLAQFLRFFFFRGGECSGRRTATWQRRDETIGALCCFIAFAAAAFEFLAEQEAVTRGTTNTTYRLAFVFATLCRRHCAGAFSSSFDPTACGPPAPGFVSAVLVPQRPQSLPTTRKKGFILSEHMKDNFLPQICIRSPRIKRERAQQWNVEVVWKMTGTISSLSLCRLKDLFLWTWNIPLTWNTSFECKLKPPRPKRPVLFGPFSILCLKHLVQAVNFFLGGGLFWLISLVSL